MKIQINYYLFNQEQLMILVKKTYKIISLLILKKSIKNFKIKIHSVIKMFLLMVIHKDTYKDLKVIRI